MKARVAWLTVGAFVFGCLFWKAFTGTPKERQQLLSHNRRYALMTAFSALPCWNLPHLEWEKIGRQTSGVTTLYRGPNTGDSSKQIEELEVLASQKVDGIILFPADDKALAPEIDKLVAQNIPVITIFSDVPGSERLTYVGGSEVDAGRAVARQLLADFPSFKTEETLAIFSTAKSSISSQIDRRTGIEQVLREEKVGLRIVEAVLDDIDETKGAEAVHAALLRHPNARVIIGTDSRSAIGAITALKELGRKPGEVIVTGWDSDADVLRAIQEGWVHLAPSLHLTAMVQIAFSFLEAHRFGYLYPEDNKNPWMVPDHVEVPLNMVTHRNGDDFLRHTKL